MPMDFATASVEDAIAGIEKLKISSSKKGKENAGPSAKESLATAQLCLKAAQKRLAQPGEDVAQLAALCHSTLRLMEQHGAAARPTQLHTAAYTTIRALVSAKAYAPALHEALRLHAALDKAYNVAGGAIQPGDLPSDVVNLGVGAALTLALCWAEGAGSGSQQLSYVLHAAETAQDWFRLLPSDEAHTHSQTLFKSLYRGAARMMERQRWEGLPAVCSSMVAAAGVAAGPLALSAAAKLAQHAPDLQSIAILASVVSGVPSDNFKGDLHKAALTPASLLRKRVATAISGLADPKAVLQAVGGSKTAASIAAALDAGAAIVGRGAGDGSGSTAEAFMSHSHSAAVSISCAARLRAASAALGVEADWAAGSEAAAAVLGWRWPAWADARHAHQVLSTQELLWLSSNMFNVGLELQDAAAAATGAGFAALLSAACQNLVLSFEASLAAFIGDTNNEQLVQDAARRAGALVEALAAAGRGADAVTTAATATVAVLSVRPDFSLSALYTIISAAVKHLAQAGAAAGEGATSRPARRQAGRGAPSASATAASITVEAQQDTTEPSNEVVAAVARAELAAWAAELAGRGGLPPPAAAEAAAGAAARHLLEVVYPAKSAPLDHVRTLLLMHSLGIMAGGEAPLAAAETALKPLSKRGDPEAAALAALVAAQKALDEAQVLVEAAVAEQAAAAQARRRRVKENPSEIHADDNADVSKDVGSVRACQTSQEDWSRVAAAAADAVQQVAAALESGAAQSTELLLAPCVLELGVVCGSQGLAEAEAAALEVAAALGRGVDAGALAPGTLTYCILPACSVADSVDAAKLEAAANELVSGGRAPTLLLRRAELCMAASLRHEASGAAIPALHCAGEAHRLLSSLVRGDSSSGGVSAPAGHDARDGESPGWWRLAAAYCRSLALVGRLFECAGMAEEAVSALREGQRMAESMGGGLIGAFFSAQLALLWVNSGQTAPAAIAAEAANTALDGTSEAVNDSPAGLFVKVLLCCAQARLHEGTQVALASHAAVEAAEALAEFGDADNSIQTHAEVALASAHLCMVETLRTEGRAPSEIAGVATQGLARLGVGGRGAFTAAPRSALLLAQAEAEAHPSRPEKLKTARLWAPGQFAAELGDGDEEAAALRWAATPGLWAALAASRGAPHVHRRACAQLAPAVAAAGCPSLSALLLHAGSGTTLQMQHRLVLHARERVAQRRQETSAAADASSTLEVLDSGLDWSLIERSLATADGNGPEPSSKVTKRGGRRTAAKAAPGAGLGAAAALASLEVQAEQALDKWLAALPCGTAVCSVGCRRVASEAHPTRPQDCLVVSRLRSGSAPPVIMDIPMEAYGALGSFQHPIRALALFGDDSDSEASSAPAATAAVASAVAEMERVLKRSTHSMKSMPTDTKDQQREWWRTRVDLDDALAALLAHLDASWLGPWRCLLLGSPEGASESEALLRRAGKVVVRLAEATGRKGGVELPPAVEELAAAVLYGVSGMSQQELRHAAATLCAALGGGPVDTGSGLAASAATILAQATAEEPKAEPAPPETVAKPRRVTFCQDGEPDADGSTEASPPPSLRRAVSFIDDTLGDSSAGNLCARFDALAVDNRPPLPSAAATPGLGLPARTPGAATLRAKKHKSRLGMLQSSAATPAPKSARKPLRALGDAGGPPTAAATSRVAATAPRPPRPMETPAAARTMPARARPAARAPVGPSGAPVVAIFSPELQSLPWESIPGLAAQRIYRLPALPCAAAAAASRTTPAPAISASSAYYLINPSGDLQTTQDTFEAWFQGLSGWRGRAGCPPPPAELATALQAEQLFVYCGHGGGEQYLPPARLRGMPRCAAALLMGCSSGRLRGGGGSGFYEPTGVVLAYLLAGCPAAVANLWDVTDRDIDRFAQAVLTRWLSGAAEGRDAGDVAAGAAAARSACKLPCLIGAAPVCYGIPTLVQPPCAA